MPDFLTRKGAKQVTDDIDRIANLFQAEFKALGIPKKVATDFCYRCDLIADAVRDHAAALEVAKQAETEVEASASNGGFDPEEIAEKKPGPEEMEKDEPYMKGQFTQQDKSELREKQEGGNLASPDKMSSDDKIAELSSLVANLTNQLQALTASKKSEEEEEETDDEAGKKATEVEAAKKSEDEEEEADESASKKASNNHGYDLFA